MTALNRDDLLEGVCFSLAHAVQLLDEAAVLFAHRCFPTSFFLGVFSREEHGRATLLTHFARDVGSHGSVPLRDVQGELNPSKRPHHAKLEAGQSTFLTNVPLPAGETFAERQSRYAAMRKQDSARLHEQRLLAQYVDLRDDGTWSKPSQIGRFDAQQLLLVVAGELHDSLMWAGSNVDISRIVGVAEIALPGHSEFQNRIFSLVATEDCA